MVGLEDIALLLVVLLVGAYYWSAQGVREVALAATRRHCERHQLQLLDDSVALRALWAKRDASGRWRLWRAYQFEFTATGDERYTGRTVTLGRQVEIILLPPHRFTPEGERLH